MNPETDFPPQAKALFPDAEVAFVKVAKGGKANRGWVTEWNEIAT